MEGAVCIAEVVCDRSGHTATILFPKDFYSRLFNRDHPEWTSSIVRLEVTKRLRLDTVL